MMVSFVLTDHPLPQDLIVSIPLGVFTASPLDSVVALQNRLVGLQVLPQGMPYSTGNALCMCILYLAVR